MVSSCFDIPQEDSMPNVSARLLPPSILLLNFFYSNFSYDVFYDLASSTLFTISIVIKIQKIKTHGSVLKICSLAS